MAIDSDGVDNAVRILSRLVLAEETLEATLSRVASLACRTRRFPSWPANGPSGR